MITFAARRWFAIALITVITLVGAAVLLSYSLSLGNTAFLTGWVMLAMILFLVSYNLRKKLTYPPLLKSSTWLQLHVYVGLLSVVLFLFHTGWRMPNGAFEGTLAVLYACVAGSGLAGLALSRLIPARLTARGEEVLFERIALYRRELRDRAETLVVDSLNRSGTTTLSDLYVRRLADFFHGSRHVWHHLVQSTRPLKLLTNELRALERYLDDRERDTARELAELVEAKDNLDYHYAMQGVLKGWLFVHIPLTYVLLLFIALHVVVVHAFSGGVR